MSSYQRACKLCVIPIAVESTYFLNYKHLFCCLLNFYTLFIAYLPLIRTRFKYAYRSVPASKQQTPKRMKHTILTVDVWTRMERSRDLLLQGARAKLKKQQRLIIVGGEPCWKGRKLLKQSLDQCVEGMLTLHTSTTSRKVDQFKKRSKWNETTSIHYRFTQLCVTTSLTVSILEVVSKPNYLPVVHNYCLLSRYEIKS